jgi:hypothetical protein
MAKEVTGSRITPGRASTAPASPALRFFLGDGSVAVAKLAGELRLSKSQIAETAGLPADALYKTARLNAPKTQARLRDMLDILGRISGWAGGQDQALAWYRAHPIPAFGGRTAEALVKAGDAAAVRDYLDQVALGGFA